MRASLLLRIVALLLGLVYLPLGLVWAWLFALFVMPLGLLGLGLLRIAERRAPRAACGTVERRLHQAALVVIGTAAAASLVSPGGLAGGGVNDGSGPGGPRPSRGARAPCARAAAGRRCV